MGTFADWQPRYAEAGIATFPVQMDGRGKKPAVRNYLEMGQQASGQLLLKFGEFDAFGFACGRRSRITVLDADTKDERIFADALARHGQTKIIVRSGSGHFQAWYRHDGERRDTVSWRKRGLPIDILGGGFVVAPPSQGAYGRYQFIEGGLADLVDLPTLQGLAVPLQPALQESPAPDRPAITEGVRNTSLWRACMRQAARGGDRAALSAFATTLNRDCDPELTPDEVAGVVESAWKYTERGDNWFVRGNGMVTVSQDAVQELGASSPEALALLLMLRSWHFERDEFILANKVHKKLGWTLPKFKAATERLTKAGKIRCTHPGGLGPNDPPRYEWC